MAWWIVTPNKPGRHKEGQSMQISVSQIQHAQIQQSGRADLAATFLPLPVSGACGIAIALSCFKAFTLQHNQPSSKTQTMMVVRT